MYFKNFILTEKNKYEQELLMLRQTNFELDKK